MSEIKTHIGYITGTAPAGGVNQVTNLVIRQELKNFILRSLYWQTRIYDAATFEIIPDELNQYVWQYLTFADAVGGRQIANYFDTITGDGVSTNLADTYYSLRPGRIDFKNLYATNWLRLSLIISNNNLFAVNYQAQILVNVEYL